MKYCSERKDDKRRLCCEACGHASSFTKSPPEKYVHICRPKDKTHGLPGTELKLLLASLGISEKTGCGCRDKATQMDSWGVDGCREHFAEIREWLNQAAAKAGWIEKIRAAGNAVAAGLSIDPFDVAGSLVRIAIERATSAQSETLTSPVRHES